MRKYSTTPSTPVSREAHKYLDMKLTRRQYMTLRDDAARREDTLAFLTLTYVLDLTYVAVKA